MTYLIAQTFILLLLAGLLGLILGWYLTRISIAAERESLLVRLNNAEADARELRRELDEAVNARGNCEAERRVLADELAELKARAEALSEAGESPGEPVSAAESSPAAAPSGGENPGEAPAAMNPAETGADDLQQIKGIGPKIAGILNALGILRFEQIAAWTPENVDWVNAHLRFKGRIEREQWIPQAKALLAARRAGD
jgi:predicted flap endonuclease-1-like 5' DNA nuclease